MASLKNGSPIVKKKKKKSPDSQFVNFKHQNLLYFNLIDFKKPSVGKLYFSYIMRIYKLYFSCNDYYNHPFTLNLTDEVD